VSDPDGIAKVLAANPLVVLPGITTRPLVAATAAHVGGTEGQARPPIFRLWAGRFVWLANAEPLKISSVVRSLGGQRTATPDSMNA
jgi:hypothetical protein